LRQFEEISITPFILDGFISQVLIFTDSDFREVVLSAFLHKSDQSDDELSSSLPVFSGFDQFVQIAGWIQSAPDPLQAAATDD
jgi:hypothetical protein